MSWRPYKTHWACTLRLSVNTKGFPQNGCQRKFEALTTPLKTGLTLSPFYSLSPCGTWPCQKPVAHDPVNSHHWRAQPLFPPQRRGSSLKQDTVPHTKMRWSHTYRDQSIWGAAWSSGRTARRWDHTTATYHQVALKFNSRSPERNYKLPWKCMRWYGTHVPVLILPAPRPGSYCGPVPCHATPHPDHPSTLLPHTHTD